MTSELVTPSAHTEALREQIPAGADITSGSPRAGFTELAVIDGVAVGVWEMTPGVATDVEDDELFVILSGTGSLTLADGRVVDLTAGTVVHLDAGERTVWSVTQTVRKIYVSRAP